MMYCVIHTSYGTDAADDEIVAIYGPFDSVKLAKKFTSQNPAYVAQGYSIHKLVSPAQVR